MSRLSSQLLYEKGLIDPVSTGYDGNAAFSPTSRNITVVRARNGYRAWFKGVDHTRHPGATTVEVMGNHCNIGGGHDHGIAARVLEASTAWFRTSGVPIGEVRPQSRYDGQATIYHERDIPCADDVSRASRSPVARGVALGLGAGRRRGLGAVRDLQDDGHGQVRRLLRRQTPPGSGPAWRASLDQRLTPPAYPEPIAGAGPVRAVPRAGARAGCAGTEPQGLRAACRRGSRCGARAGPLNLDGRLSAWRSPRAAP